MSAVLLVGLPKSIAQVFNELLLHESVELLSCPTGLAALELASSYDVRCIITCYELKDISADDFCQQLREVAYESLPIFLYTSHQEFLDPINIAVLPFTEVYLSDQLDLLESHILKIVQDLAPAVSESKCVLLVEDDPVQREVFKHILEAERLNVVCAESYESAVESLKQHTIDLVILDVILKGGISGINFIHHVRSLKDSSKETPILVLSAYTEVSRIVEVYRMGANDYLSKPYSVDILISRVRNLIRFKEALDTIYKHEKTLEHMAMHDALTGLHNRRYFVEACEGRISESRRQSFPISLIVLDVDNFKTINDTYGHTTGDEVLIEIGRILQSQCRESDLCARIGGEEFVLMYTYCNIHDGEKKANDIVKAVASHTFSFGRVTVSAGITALDEDKQRNSFETMFSVADSALYTAKNEGKNCVRVGE